MKEIVKHKIKHNLTRILTSIKWVIFAILSGLVVGGVGTLFYFSMSVNGHYANRFCFSTDCSRIFS